MVHRDVNHPSIIAWVPYNERTDVSEVNRVVVQETVDMTRILDPHATGKRCQRVHSRGHRSVYRSRLRSGPERVIARYDSLSPEKNTALICHPEASHPYSGQPYIVDEYGEPSEHGISFHAAGKQR